ncbi:MAG: gliding motility-associated C-terminal domain-containing protein [Bacteroidales bacterium]|nr:gliding motility-associated C-terminal domain-containing protein [Bacteroidales bacterium]
MLKKTKKIIVILATCCSALAFGQIHESFKHHDSLNHQWFGDTAYFSVENEKLQLNGPQSSSTLYYAARNTLSDSIEWNFSIQLSFNPSSTNFVRVYLMSDSENLRGSLNGYFVQLGQTGGRNNIQFFRQEGTAITLVFSGVSEFSSSSGLSLQLRVKRFPNSEWHVYSDVSSRLPIDSEGEPFVDSTFRETAAFGFFCRYSTASRHNMYAFGEVKVGTIEPDPIPEPPIIIEDFDVVISEIMFNPPIGSAEYLEIFNRSEQDIPFSELRLGRFNNQDQLSGVLAITADEDLVLPSQVYVVLSRTPEILWQYHNVCADALLITMPNLPALSNTSGRYALLRKDSTFIDEIYYHSSMHFALLADTRGVSLERLSFEKSGTDAGNWHSASSTSGYATPGCPNSQGISRFETDKILHLYPSLISPNNDGKDDILTISYNLETSGFTGNIRIFNSNGRMVRHLVKSELLGIQGTYFWDGLSDQNTKLSSGVYIVVFDIFLLDGRTVRVKKPVGYR